MATLIWTEPALQDLDAIADYITLDKPTAAKRFVAKVFEKVARLKRFPKSGAIPPEISDLPYRQLIIPPCRLFYRYDGKTAFILFVMRSK